VTRGRVPFGRSSTAGKYHSNVRFAIYRVGPGAADPKGIGEGASLALPRVLGGFRRVDEPVNAATTLVVEVVPDCWQDARQLSLPTICLDWPVCWFISIKALCMRWL